MMEGPGWPSHYKAEFAEQAVAPCLTDATRTRRALEEVSEPARPGEEAEAAETIPMDTASGLHLLAQPVDRRLGAALAVRDAQRLEPDFDHAQRAQYHRRVDMAHMGDANGLAGELADALAENDAAFLVAEGAQRLRIMAAVHQHRGDGVGTLGRLDDVEADRLAFRPDADGATHRFRQQLMSPEDVVEAFLEQHVERLAHAEQQVLGRGAGVFLVVLVALAVGPVPIGRAQAGLLVHL